MAVYQGARPRSVLFPGGGPRAVDAPALPRRKVRAAGAVRARRRGSHSAALIGGIVLVFLLAFFSLAQTVSVSATSYDIDRLAAERDRLEAQLRDVRSDLSRLGREPAVRKQAIDAGLGQLAEPVVVPAR
ncbi:MAG TPA: FtsL-like putative cell division protein [Vitreimonas sp.]|nr:FtsL-like putative cell division protein [Vitreimonas sp.]